MERSPFILLADVVKVTAVFKKHASFFQRLIQTDFNPQTAAYEIQQPVSPLWDAIFQNHKAMGLLFGFGEDNVDRFMETFNLESAPRERSTQEEVDFFQANSSHFTIPVFAASPQHPVAVRYQQEKKEIEEIYRGKDLFDVTLAQLTSH